MMNRGLARSVSVRVDELGNVESVDGTDVDDPGGIALPGALLQQGRKLASHVKQALDVQREYALPRLFVVFLVRRSPGIARIVDQDMKG